MRKVTIIWRWGKTLMAQMRTLMKISWKAGRIIFKKSMFFPKKNLKNHWFFIFSLPEEKKLLDSKIEKKEWILECERVSSKLKLVVKSDAKEWRSHIETTKVYSENIKKIMPDSRACLEKISEELGKVLEGIGKRERNINVNMNEIVWKY